MRIPVLSLLAGLFLASITPLTIHAQTRSLNLAERLSGRILLQVENHGEAWYIDPISKQRFYLGTANDAFQLLRSKGLGIRHSDVESYLRLGRFPARLAGRILIDVGDRGQAYYILPQTLRAARLGTADETYQVLRQNGLGIKNQDLNKIPSAPQTSTRLDNIIPTPQTPSQLSSSTSPIPPSPPAIQPTNPSSALQNLEQQTHEAINQHRASIGVPPLVWNDAVAEVARIHSENMGAGRVAFGHDGFNDRFTQINTRIRLSRMAENVAMNTYDDPVATAVRGWIASEGHRINLENSLYTQTGIGIAKVNEDEYFFTQLFITPSQP